MKKSKYLLFILISFCIYKKTFSAEKITFAADYWCPYNCHPNTPTPGYIIDMLYEIYGKDTVDYIEINWARAIFETKKGKFNAIVAAGTSEAPGFIYSKNIVGTQTVCLYTKLNSTLNIKNLDDLQNHSLGIIKNYTYYPELDKYIADAKNKKYIHENFGETAFDSMLKGLLENKYETIVETENVLDFHLKSTKIKLKTQFCATPVNLYIAFSPKIPLSNKFVETLDKGIEVLIKSGKMNIILTKYSLKPWYKSRQLYP